MRRRNSSSRRPISILFVISGLTFGGAEIMLYRLLSCMDRTLFCPQVISMIDLKRGALSEKFQTLGVRLRSLGMRPRRPNPLGLIRLAQWLRQDRPDIISTWMYHADLIGGLAAKLAGGIPVVWGIRHCDLSVEGNAWLTLQTVKACARTSRWLPRVIICNSEAARKLHVAAGYATEKMVVIPNGSDLGAFRPDHCVRESVRRELDIPQEALLIGLVGRFDALKDHCNFLQAAGILHQSQPNVYFLLCGDDVTWENPQLAHWIAEAGIAEHCRLLGRREDMPRLTAALDIAASSSFGESFSTAIVEAMSCGVPCAVTDVGDSAEIVGETGLVVSPRNPIVFANALGKLLAVGPQERMQLGIAARRRVKEQFDLPDIVARYEKLYQGLARVVRA